VLLRADRGYLQEREGESTFQLLSATVDHPERVGLRFDVRKQQSANKKKAMDGGGSKVQSTAETRSNHPEGREGVGAK